MMSDIFNLKLTDVVVLHMNTLKSSRLLKRLTVGSLIAFSLSHAAIADDVNLKTMIPGVPDIDAEAYVLIDYNSGKVLAEKNADARRDPARRPGRSGPGPGLHTGRPSLPSRAVRR